MPDAINQSVEIICFVSVSFKFNFCYTYIFPPQPVLKGCCLLASKHYTLKYYKLLLNTNIT